MRDDIFWDASPPTATVGVRLKSGIFLALKRSDNPDGHWHPGGHTRGY